MTAQVAAEVAAEVADESAPVPWRVAILGAGPIGLDAALACVDNGWPRTCAAGVSVPQPSDDSPRGVDVAEQLLRTVAELPELADAVRFGTRVLAVARHGLLKHEEIATAERAARPFRLLLAGPDGAERVEHADLVLDCTGTYGLANTLGDGRIPAPGEQQVSDRVLRHIPDVLADYECYATAAPMNLSAALLGAAGDGQGRLRPCEVIRRSPRSPRPAPLRPVPGHTAQL